MNELKIYKVKKIVFFVFILLFCFSGGYAKAEYNSTADTGTIITNGSSSQQSTVVAPDGTIYIGGNFSRVGYFSGYGATLDATTGQSVGSFPKVYGSISDVVSDGSGGWYIGGAFTQVGSYTRNRLAHINSNGTVDTNFDPNINGTVSSLFLSGSTLYAGGAFTTVNGSVARKYLAAFDKTSGTVTSFDPSSATLQGVTSNIVISGTTLYVGETSNLQAFNINTGSLISSFNPTFGSSVFALAISGNTLYVGGIFLTVNGASHQYLTAIDATTGVATSFEAYLGGGGVYSLALSGDGSTLYLGGMFTSVNHTNNIRNHLAAISTATANLTSFNANLSATGVPLDTANTNVLKILVSGNTLYAGGNFTNSDNSHNYLASFDATTGAIKSFDAKVSRSASALAIYGSTLYAGGNFSMINSTVRNCLFAIDGNTGQLKSFDPNFGSLGAGSLYAGVVSLVLSGNTLYAGGNFTTVNGSTVRNRIAAIDTTTGVATSFDPNVNNNVYTLAISGTTLYAGGAFTTVNGSTTRNRLAAFDTTTTGTATSFNPNMSSSVRSLLVSGTTLYAGGDFTTINTSTTRNRLASFDITNGTVTSFDPNVSSSVYGLSILGNTLYAGGSFTTVNGSTTRNYLAAFDTTTSTATSFNPNMSASVRVLFQSGTTLYVGGTFATVNGSTARNGLASFDTINGTLTFFNPNIGGNISALAISGTKLYASGSFVNVGSDLERQYFAQFFWNYPPTATNVTISGTPNVGQVLTGNYTYSDADNDTEGVSTFRWLRDDVAIANTTRTYTTTLSDLTHTIKFEVTPVATTGTTPGVAVVSSGAVIVDTTPPTSTITSICATVGNKCTSGGAILNPEETYTIQKITGTAGDDLSLTSIQLSIKDDIDNKYYSNGSFSSDSEVYNSVTGTTSWTYNVSTLPFTISHTYTLNAKATDIANNTHIATIQFKFINLPSDTIGPVITLSGENPMSVTIGTPFTDPGATATDAVDGTRVVQVSGTVNTNALGTYLITYTAVDLSGNTSTATRTVNVILAPTYNITASSGAHGSISPNGITTVTSGTDQTFTFTPNTSDTDKYKVSSIMVDGKGVALADNYTFSNVATDHTISVTFSLIDAVPPQITILGDNPLNINSTDTYVDPGATAIDVASNTPVEVTTTGEVNTKISGTYTITYYATDLSGNTATATRSVIVKDNIPPVISDISTPVLSSNAAVIVWTTDEPATTQISWSMTSGNLTRTTILNDTLSTYHVVSLGPTTFDTDENSNILTSDTPYFYKVKSNDASGNAAVSEEKTFSTLKNGQLNVFTTKSLANISSGGGSGVGNILDKTPPKITNMKIADVSSFSATITFDTDKETLASIDYGKTIDYGNNAEGSLTPVWNFNHTIKLTGLSIGTDYHFRIVAIDKGGNVATSEDQTFKTKFFSENINDLAKIDNLEQFQKEVESTIESILPSLVPPFVEKPEVNNITENSAVVDFKTNIKSYGVVGYVPDSEYDGTKANPYKIETSDTTNKTNTHSLILSNLKSNTKYRAIARAFSLPQVVGKSQEFTFSTEASKIEAIITNKTNNSFTVVWTTDEPTTSIVEYKNEKTGIVSKVVDDVKNSSHSMKVENLTPGTTYTVNISGINNEGNLVEGNSAITVITSTDITPPVISNLKVDSAMVAGRDDRIQSIVSWTTDEPATSSVYYEEGAGTATDTLSNKQEDTATLTTNHTVILSTLKPGTIYRLQVSSTDDAGNIQKLPVRTIITPVKNQSIVDIIFKNFDQTFNFLGKVR